MGSTAVRTISKNWARKLDRTTAAAEHDSKDVADGELRNVRAKF